VLSHSRTAEIRTHLYPRYQCRSARVRISSPSLFVLFSEFTSIARKCHTLRIARAKTPQRMDALSVLEPPRQLFRSGPRGSRSRSKNGVLLLDTHSAAYRNMAADQLCQS